MTKNNSRDEPKLHPKLPCPTVAIGCVLMSLVAAVYGQVAWHDFVEFDDGAYVYENRQVLQGLTIEGIKWAFTTWHASNWHPLTWLSLMLDVEIYGQRAGGFHITNVIFHTINVLLLFKVMRCLTGAAWRSAAVAALFAIHPLHVQSVVWITERKDVLSTLFWMLTLLAYAFYVRQGARKWYLLTGAMMALGLMAKPMLVTLPCVLLLLDWWPLSRFKFPNTLQQVVLRDNTTEPLRKHSFRSLVWEKIPLFGLSAISCVVTVLCQRSGMQTLEALTWGERFANALVAYITYLIKFIWPTDLAVFYPYQGAPDLWKIMGALILLCTVAYAFKRLHRKHPFWVVGWLWYLGTLVPVIGILQVGAQSLADRYTYVPLIGIYILLAWGSYDLVVDRPALVRFMYAIVPIILLGFAVRAWQQTGYWKDSSSLFEHSLAVTQDNWLIDINYGVFLEKNGEFSRAETHFRNALRVAPGNVLALTNLGLVLGQLQRPTEAASCLRKAITLDSSSAKAHNLLGVLLLQQGDVITAREHLKTAVLVAPKNGLAHYDLGVALDQQGELTEAVKHLRTALRLGVGNGVATEQAQALLMLGVVYIKQQKFSDAAKCLTDSIALDAGNAEARNNLGFVLIQQGNLDRAVIQLREAIRLNADQVDAHYNLGTALTQLQQYSQALSHLEKTVELDPDNADRQNMLGTAYLLTKDHAAAVVHLHKAIALAPDMIPALNNLAWIRATHPDRDFRDAAQAVYLAEKANQLTGGKDSDIHDTLAAAYAEAEAFDQAVAAAKKAIALADLHGQTSVIERQKRLKLYRKHLAYRDKSLSNRQ